MTLLKRFIDFIVVKFSAFLSRFEDPIEKCDHAIKKLVDLRRKTHQSLAQTQALITTTTEDIEHRTVHIKEAEDKAYKILEQASKGVLEQTYADSLASQLISNKLRSEKDLERLKNSLDNYSKLYANLEIKMTKIKQQISDYEFELASLKSRKKVASALREIGESMSSEDANSVVSLMSDATTAVRNEEALAEAYDSLNSKTLDEQVNEVLGTDLPSEVSEELTRMKESLNK